MYLPRAVSNMATLTMLASLLLSTAVCALSTDSEQPIEIEADFAEFDDEKGYTIYTGNVVVVQGSLRMTGQSLKVNFTPDREVENAYLKGTKTKLAYFKQTPDGGEFDTEGEALEMEYLNTQSLLYLIERAKLSQGPKLFTGDKITYDTENSILRGERVKQKLDVSTSASETPKPSGRVKVIIPPRKKKSVSE